MTITLNINDRAVEVPDGSSVLDAVNTSGTYIPQLGKDPDMKAIGACRTCLVQIEGVRGLPASCSVPAEQGMSVLTETDEARDTRRGVLELTMAMFPKNGETPSHNYRELSIAAKHHAPRPPHGQDGRPIELIQVAPNASHRLSGRNSSAPHKDRSPFSGAQTAWARFPRSRSAPCACRCQRRKWRTRP